MLKILFVCLGNFCRSPMAQAIMEHKIQKLGLDRNLFLIDSAGTSTEHNGKTPDYRTIKTLRKYGIKCNHISRLVQPEDFFTCDYIFAMDKFNLMNLKDIGDKLPSYKSKIQLLRDFDPLNFYIKNNNPAGENKTVSLVPDPFYGDLSDFEYVYKILDRTIENLVRKIGIN